MTNTIAGSVVFHMQSDWHIGTGTGIPGSVDALVIRDQEGFPFIPAKSVTGIWRDAMEMLVFGLELEGETKWRQWVDVIFGSQPNIDSSKSCKPRPAILQIRPARFSDALRSLLAGKPEYVQALTFVKPETAIDKNSGTAEDKSLRFIEMARMGAVLTGEFSVDCFGLNEDQIEFTKALLVASAKFVDRIGGNRRRGAGKCKMEMEFVGVNLLDYLPEGSTPAKKGVPKCPDSRELGEIDVVAGAKLTQTAWLMIEYDLRLNTPVAIATNTFGNVTESLDYVPGTYILPLISKQVPGINDAIAQGDVQVSAALPVVGGNRGVPVPRVFWHDKVNGGFDRVGSVFNGLTEDLEGSQKKNFREGYVGSVDFADCLPQYGKVPLVLRMHNTVDDVSQRPTSEVGGVYSRYAIPAETHLKGHILFHDSLKKAFEPLCSKRFRLRLGTSKKDDYGDVELVFGEKIVPLPSEPSSGEELVVFFESDTLIRTSHLRQSNLIEDIRRQIELRLSTVSNVDARIKETVDKKKSLITTRRIESWNARWGLPRPSLMAISAGSVAVFEFEGEPPDKGILKRIESDGIGERRAEGFGRIRINPPLLLAKISELDRHCPTEEKPPADAKDHGLENASKEQGEPNQIDSLEKATVRNTLQENEREFLKIIERSFLKRWITNASQLLSGNLQKSKDLWGFPDSRLPMSQIGGLRSIIGRVRSDGSNREIVIEWLNHLKETPNRKRKWNDQFGKIAEVFSLESPQTIWKELEKKIDLPEDLGSQGVLKTELWAHAVKTSFAHCAKAHKRKLEL